MPPEYVTVTPKISFELIPETNDDTLEGVSESVQNSSEQHS